MGQGRQLVFSGAGQCLRRQTASDHTATRADLEPTGLEGYRNSFEDTSWPASGLTGRNSFYIRHALAMC
jgi:hypothetical protein